jgi:hypothetical protein
MIYRNMNADNLKMIIHSHMILVSKAESATAKAMIGLILSATSNVNSFFSLRPNTIASCPKGSSRMKFLMDAQGTLPLKLSINPPACSLQTGFLLL